MRILLLLSGLMLFIACDTSDPAGFASDDGNEMPDDDTFYYGADLSYVNEMEDCGATYSNQEGTAMDPYEIFSSEGANLIRVRLWHTPDWTDYSTLADVKETITRAKALDMEVLLDFHLSDTWADPSHQQIPAAWIDDIDNTTALGELLYTYISDVLTELANEELLPEIVQVGNEINPMILQDGDLEWPIDWARNASLINKGISAVRDVAATHGAEMEVMLHIAQPENGLWWFEQATAAGVTDYDWIGLSYYPVWSDYTLANVNQPITTLINTYNKNLMVVETAYPFTLEDTDNANNILGTDALIDGIPASPEGQLSYMNQLKEVIENAGGRGLIYWEPAWVSTGCNTLWGTGSHWNNATMFDENNQAHVGITFYNQSLE